MSALARCVGAGGVVVFPADTVYGLGCDPENAAAVGRLYELKGRAGDKPAAVMWGTVDGLLADVDDLGRRTRLAVERLLPGRVTLLVENRRGRFPLAGGRLLGVRVPSGGLDLEGPLLQSSANVAGGPDARRLADVPRAIRDGADLVLDGGDLPGVPSTVVDLSDYESAGAWRLVRVGAVGAEDVRDRLAGRGRAGDG
ncbi:MAG TPA: L-threonylcarbamoyladenylate synthase [Solirubrobacteraceae bacterium]|nr:L-threonylcarbamoyladenylate synthase [Solirubrobacteraceae bacterium]